jgi:hypothetical protein
VDKTLNPKATGLEADLSKNKSYKMKPPIWSEMLALRLDAPVQRIEFILQTDEKKASNNNNRHTHVVFAQH